MKPLTVFLDPLVNERNPHLTLLHKGLQYEGENDVRELRLTTFIIQLPLKRLTEYSGRRVALHFHFVNRFYESRSRVEAIARFLRLIGAVAWCRMFGVRILWTMHDDGAHAFRYRSVERFFLFCFVQLCDRILTLSERGRGILWERYGRTEGIVFTPHPPYNGVYPNVTKRQQARRSLGIRPKESLYLFMGRVMPYKGLEELIAVFRGWKPSRKVRLLILGPSQNGAFAARLKELAKEDLRIRVATEFVSERKIDLYMNAADFGVLPYRRILHSGTTMMFMTFGCPVIVPRLGWFPEIFQNHRIGIMYDPDVPDGLRSALDRSLSEPKKRFQEDIDRFCRSWSLESAIQLTAGVYRGLP